jgi:hypothetical protein
MSEPIDLPDEMGGMIPSNPLSESEAHEYEQLRVIVGNLSEIRVKSGLGSVMVSTDNIVAPLLPRYRQLQRRLST